ncbi:MAG: hypothetical protein JWP16_1881 [Alphaproteobacteria bacterium]|nr:hypothetical protein [Alphaproteobacteria bacterium]MDB5740841.1 hypothetical protein [Alphaproteobacteria bacterium]
MLQGCLEEICAARYGLLTTAFSMSLVHGFAVTGRFAQALAFIDEVIVLDDVRLN